MSLTEQGATGRAVNLAPDAVLGVVQQDVESTLSGYDLTTSGNKQAGIPIVVGGTLSATADGTQTWTLFSSNAPNKYRVVDAWYYMRSHRTGGSPAHTLQIKNGANALSNAADTDTAAQGVVNTPYRWGTLDDAYIDIAAAGSLTVELVVGGTTTTGTALCDFYLLLLPVN